jgi:hypothetical protein
MMFQKTLAAAGAAMIVCTLVPGLCGAQMPAPIEVTVERTKPPEEKLSNLRFFKDNLDFLRSRLDGLQEMPRESGQEARALDERLLRYQDMIQEARAARDSIDSEQARRDKEAFLSSVTELGELDAHLDYLEEVLNQQEKRLGVLQEDFLGDQRTAMIVVVKGAPSGNPLTGLRIMDGFDETTEAAFTPQRQTALSEGGIVQVYHALVEPREQTWEIVLLGPGWGPDPAAYLTFTPRRNRLGIMMLDLSAADPTSPAPGLAATAWVHDPSVLTRGGAQ